jgi:23S rRNA (adenine2503-C2)-methyltransferase
MGMVRNLSSGEIVGQVLAAIRDGCLTETRYNIVLMGMGEPLHNYKNVMKAFRLLTDPAAMGLSSRRITLSTSGVVPVLQRMSQEASLPNLAISLNATTNPIRTQLMPINERWDLEKLMNACRDFPLEPRRRITFEYVLIKNLNESDQDAHRLAQLLKGIKAKVNLIPYNSNPNLPFERPTPLQVDRFREILTDYHISAFVRRPRGDDISAACGQLAWMESVDSRA